MNGGGSARRNARASLDAARPVIARLESSRSPDDAAADLIEGWGAVESALRSLVGGSTLTGQAVIREARQRQLINFDQANALAEFQAVRDRVEHTSYHPTDADITAARSAFQKLDTALIGDGTADGASTGSAASAASAAAAASMALPPTSPMETPVTGDVPSKAPRISMGVGGGRGVPVWAALLVLVIAVGVIGGAIYYGFARSGGGGGGSLEKGIQYFRNSQREAAVGEFNKAARENPKSALPHVYLARMAREVGNFPMAGQELNTALTLEPNNALALREMGANLLAQGNYDLARRFYVRAVTADPSDKTAIGYLGCSLMRLGRTAEAQTFLNRAGEGPWSNCPPGPPTQPGQPGAQPIPGQPVPIQPPRP